MMSGESLDSTWSSSATKSDSKIAPSVPKVARTTTSARGAMLRMIPAMKVP